jgi:L-rhamnose mutarotase
MRRHVLTVDLRDDPAAIATYRDYHQQVWPEVLESLRRAGVRSMDIRIHGRRLVMILELSDGLDVQQVFGAYLSSHPRVQEWERLMQSLWERPSDAPPGEWWAVMEPIFQLS